MMPLTIHRAMRASATLLGFFGCLFSLCAFAKPAQALTTITPQADASVASGKLAAQNFGAVTTLTVNRTTNDATSSRNQCAYLKFDLTKVTTVYRATLMLNVSPTSTPANGTATVTAYDVPNTTWTETGLTWNTAPGLDPANFSGTGTLIGAQQALLVPGTVTFDVTSFVKAHAGSLATIQLMNTVLDRKSIVFDSREAATGQPVITVTNTMAAAPVLSPRGGTYAGTQTVAIADATPGVTIRYTTDGTQPNATSPVYYGPIQAGASQTVTAYATGDGIGDSTATAAAYTITPAASQTFVARLFGAQATPGNGSSALGVATLVLNANRTSALVSLQFSGLSGETAAHIHGPADTGVAGAPVLCDLSSPLGSFSNRVWTFQPVAGLTTSQLLSDLQSGLLYADVHSASFPSGEIRGQFTPAALPAASAAPMPRPDAPDDADAVRFLEQTTFGPTLTDVAHLKQIGLRAYLNEQFAAPPSSYAGLPNGAPSTSVSRTASYPEESCRTRFFDNAVHGPDQLRQRVALALSQVLVTSLNDNAVGNKPGDAYAAYMGALSNDAFGNYRTLLQDVTLTPFMGHFLDMINNVQANPKTNTAPNENFGREVMQLFTLGTELKNLDGSAIVSANGTPVPTYGNSDVTAMARTLTGWKNANWTIATARNFDNADADYLDPMIAYEPDHDSAAKTLVGGAPVPAGQTAEEDLGTALDTLYRHPNIAPFLSRILIQHLVTANPSPGYVARVAAVFNNNGQGVRGDLKAVLSAILLDGEAGEAGPMQNPAYGHLREPALFVCSTLRALNATGGDWGLSYYCRSQGQDVFAPATVFSFYQPDYMQAYGSLSFYHPEAELMTMNTELARMNYVEALVYSTLSVSHYAYPLQPGQTAPVVDFSGYDALAADPGALTIALNALFFHGAMTADMQSAIIDAITAVPATTPHARVQQALYLVLTSMQYQVEQ